MAALMGAQLDPITLSGFNGVDAEPQSDADMDGGLFGGLFGLSGGSDSKMVRFLEAQGDVQPLNSLGAACKGWLSLVTAKTWSYAHHVVKVYDQWDTPDYGCTQLVGVESSECRTCRYYRCSTLTDISMDVRDVANDIGDATAYYYPAGGKRVQGASAALNSHRRAPAVGVRTPTAYFAKI
eukprot:5734093-Pyramimonas_sp.AAC.3